MRGPVMVGGGLMTLLLVLVVWLLGGDPMALLQQVNQGQPGGGQAGPLNPAGRPEAGIDDAAKEFVAIVLADTEDVWREQLPKIGRQYRDPTLVLFSDATQSACGFAQSATGPFYCPADEQVYLDTAFFRELEQRFRAPGDFAKAYVIAHEVGHHVQQISGLERPGACRPAAGGQSRGQQAFRAAGAAGRLSGRRLGPSCPSRAADSGAGRRRGGPDGRHGHRRRPPAARSPPAMSCPIRSRMARAPSGCAGSGAAWNRAI